MKLNLFSLLLFAATSCVAASSLRNLQISVNVNSYSQIVAKDYYDYAVNVSWIRENVTMTNETDGTTYIKEIKYVTDPDKACVKFAGTGPPTVDQALILGNCSKDDIGYGEGWRLDENHLLHSKEDESLCVQVGRGNTPESGRVLRLYGCNATKDSQLWHYNTFEEQDSLRPYFYRYMCMVWNGATPSLDVDEMLVDKCPRVRGRRGWNITADAIYEGTCADECYVGVSK